MTYTEEEYYDISTFEYFVYEASHSALAIEYFILVIVASYILAKLLRGGQTLAYKILFLVFVIIASVGMLNRYNQTKHKII